MDLSKISIEELKYELNNAIEYLQWSHNLVSKPGGWIVWNGNEEERVERIVNEIRSEIRKRNLNN